MLWQQLYVIHCKRRVLSLLQQGDMVNLRESWRSRVVRLKMERKIILTENSLHQMQEFVIDKYDDHIKMMRFLSSDIENVEIPDIIEGKPVTIIGGDCFFCCENIKTISFPQTIVSIEAQAFALCKGLAEVILPDSIIEIGPHAFRDCSGIKRFVFPRHLKRIETGIFAFCDLFDVEIILPEKLEIIERNAFFRAGRFDLVIPDSVKEIGVGAFHWGPHPITSLQEDNGWYSEWPYGEKVIYNGLQGRITDLYYLERGCMLHDVTVGTDIKQFVYPCDYIDGNISFLEEDNQQIFQNNIRHYWDVEDRLKNAYKIMNAWKRGFISPR